MNIAEAKEQIKATVDAYLERDETGAYEIPVEGQRPLFLLGAPGIGKTAVVGQVARELGIGLVSYSMTHHTRQSALGLPFIVHKEYGDESFDVSEYTMSEIIASLYDYRERTGHERGILFLDEINCVSETLYPSMLQFLQFKTFGRHRVPDGWVVVCAGNPPEYNKSVYDFDVVTLDRLRKVEVEPDLDAWMGYALATGVHPAIVSYLQVKRDQFYSIESTPSGKSFVTARGWDDLSRVMKLYERKGHAIDCTLVSQFIQDEGIAERFAQYYALFAKYRSDYRVKEILSGDASGEIVDRAKAARLDERLAVVRLLLDGLDSTLSATMERKRVIAYVRDELRGAKEQLLAGASVHDTLEKRADEWGDDIDRRIESEAADASSVREERRAVSELREHVLACEQERVIAGEDAFKLVSSRYARDVDGLKQLVEASGRTIDNAFAFLDEAFGDGREMNAFVAELTGRPSTAAYLAKFGSDSYYAHNSAVLAATNPEALRERIES
ncbi:MAG: AAA family ATPase, partial [Eggerthellaceae bacterium]|nr:AAA family ATPase [Eggerthellaceae bacterium]